MTRPLKPDRGPASSTSDVTLVSRPGSARWCRVNLFSRRAKYLTAVLAAALLALVCTGCHTHRSASSNIPPRLAGQTPSTLAVGDVVKLTFPGAPELTHAQKIRADGKISLPMIGETQAAGKRVSQLQSQLTEMYKDKLQNKEVIVTVESSAIPVYVSGAVNRPGKIALDRSMTVLEAVMEANGFNQRANPSRVVLIRQDGGRHFTRNLDLGPALHGRQAEACYVRPYDVIHVPESFF